MVQKNREENNSTFEQLGPSVPFSFSVNLLNTGRECCDPLHYAGPCYKKVYLLHFVKSGKGVFRCNGEEHTLKRGDLFFLTPTDYVFYQADEQDPWEYVWVRFDGKSVSYLVENAGINKRVFSLKSEEDFNMVSDWYDKVYEYMQDSVAPYFRATGMFFLMFGWLLKEFGQNSLEPEDKMSFTKMLSFINHHYTEDIDMAMLESVSNYNRSHIYKIFMQNAKCSPKQYIDTLRLDLACEMLNETGYSINEIALRVGYKNYISFVNAFKKKYNTLPTAYRTNEKRNIERMRQDEKTRNS